MGNSLRACKQRPALIQCNLKFGLRIDGQEPLGARMLDGKRYFAEFPDEDSGMGPQGAKLLLSNELMVTLAAIEKELSAFIRREANAGAVAALGDREHDSVPSRNSAET